MTKTKNKFVSVLFAALLTCATSLTQAQGGPGDPGDDPDPSQTVPIDGGLSLVIAAGIAYATKKGYDKRKKQNSPQQTEK